MLAERVESRVGALLLTLNLVLVGAVSADPDAAGDLLPGVWRIDTPLGSVTGACLYLVDGADSTSWRCEIAVAEGGVEPTRDDLLQRRGRGWTLTGGGFIQPWHEPWRRLGAAATESTADLLRSWSHGPDIPATNPAGDDPGHRWRLPRTARPLSIVIDDWSGLPAAWRPPDASGSVGGVLRRRLTARGTGRGGDGVVLDLRWRSGSLAVTSARWPGRLTVESAGRETAAVPEEAFLPLWPLTEFLR